MLNDNKQQSETATKFVQRIASDRNELDLALLGSSHAIRTLRTYLAKIAPTEANLLLRGEAGTGKQAVGLAVHHRSARRKANFVTLCCGAVGAGDISDAFLNDNWARQTHPSTANYLARAQGGTLFLQDVTELPIEAQHCLQTLLRDNSMAVPGTQQPLDVRIIASTVGNPLHAIETGALSAEFYYQLSEYQLETSPLRHRKDDIPVMAQKLLDEYAGPQRRFDEAALEALARYHYPGNLQEFKNVIAHAAVFGGKTIKATALPNLLTATRPVDAGAVVVGESIAQVERRLIMATLDQYQGDKQRSAKTLGISVKTLYNRLRSYDRPGIR